MRHSPRRLLVPLLTAVALVAAVTPGLARGSNPGTDAGYAYPGNGQGDLIVVGDSLTEGAEYFGQMRRALLATKVWPRVTVDYKRGRTVSQGIPVLQRRLAAASEPTAIVIALGTNDMMSHPEASWPARVIDAMMTGTLGLPVMWVNITFDPRTHPDWKARANRFNRALAAAQAEWPTLSVVNWSRAFVPAGKNRFISDGVHLTISAYRTRATWIAARGAEFGRSVVWSSTTTTTTTSTTPPSTTTPTTTVPVTTTT